MRRAMCVVLCAGVALGADGDAASGKGQAKARFDAELSAVYNYLPGDVEQEVRDAKVAEMDRFWDLVKSDLETYRPLLRDALRAPDQNLYFCFDGGVLLGRVKEGEDDAQRSADAIARCRLTDIDNNGYFRFVHHLGSTGADISPAVLKLLDDPEFSVYLPKHAMRLTQSLCMSLCVTTMDEPAWVTELVARFEAETEKAARRSLLHCLTYAVRADADAVVQKIATGDGPDVILRGKARIAVRRMQVAAPKSEPSTTRAQFEEILARCVEDGRVPYRREFRAAVADALHHVRAADEPLLRKTRRKIARRVSDESPGEINQITRWLRRATMTGD